LQEERTDKKAHGHEPHLPDPGQAQPEPKAQRKFTDSDSRIMPDGANKGSFVQGYNVQAAVDASAQVIVAAAVTQETTDHRQLLPMLDQVEKNPGRKPQAASADAGYWRRPTRRIKGWRRSTCISLPDATNTSRLRRRQAGRRPIIKPRQK